jgi:diketogulonate reductase-like aldo/keto reductase
LYNNEEAIGEAVRESIQDKVILRREDIFYTGKCWNTFHSKEQVKFHINDSLKKLGFDYIDLYLIHWPMGFKENTGEPFPKDSDGNRLFSDIHYLETYSALEELVAEGKVKSIGVSNFNIKQLQDVLENCKIKPANNVID